MTPQARTRTKPHALSRAARVVRLAAASHHVVATRELASLGVSRDWIRGNVRSGLLAPVSSGTYVVGVDPWSLTRETCAMVAIKHTAARIALGSQTAMEWLGFWDRGPNDIHVVSDGANSRWFRGLHQTINVRCHRVRTLAADDVATVGGFPVATALRTIPELGAVLTAHQVAAVIWKALYAEAVDLDRLAARSDAMRHVPFTAAAREGLRLVRSGSCGTKSRSEDEVLALIERLRIPEPLVNQLGATHLPGIRLDFVWPRQRVVLELDGRHHAAMPGIEANDRAVFDALRTAGWTALRCHYSRIWSDPFGVARMLEATFSPTR